MSRDLLNAAKSLNIPEHYLYIRLNLHKELSKDHIIYRYDCNRREKKVSCYIRLYTNYAHDALSVNNILDSDVVHHLNTCQPHVFKDLEQFLNSPTLTLCKNASTVVYGSKGISGTSVDTEISAYKVSMVCL